MGHFLGFSDDHSSLVKNVRNLSTGYISPQFHLVFDDLFETFICTKDDDNGFNKIYNDLFDSNRDWYAQDEHYDNVKLIQQPPPLEDVWLDEQGRRNFRHELENNSRCQDYLICENNRAVSKIIPLAEDNNAKPPTGAPIFDNESRVDS